MSTKRDRKFVALKARVARLEVQFAELQERIIEGYAREGFTMDELVKFLTYRRREGYTINGVPNLTTQVTPDQADGVVSVPSIWTEPADVPSSVTRTYDDGVMDFSVPAEPPSSASSIIKSGGKYISLDSDGNLRWWYSRLSRTGEEEE